MARYIDADLLIETMRERYDEIRDTYGYHDLYTSGYDDAVDAVENAPTADVAPRAEVAREIFEEIEEYAELQIESLNIAEKVDLSGAAFFGGGKQAFVILLDRLAELKKKYTQPEPPEGD